MRDRDCERGGGAVSAPMAIAVLGLFVAVGLGVDGVRAAQGFAHADAVAEEAARAAGQAIDVARVRRGDVAIDPRRAVDAARRYLSEAQVDGDVTVMGPQRIRVQTRITRPTVLLGLAGHDSVTSAGSAEAVLRPMGIGGGSR